MEKSETGREVTYEEGLYHECEYCGSHTYYEDDKHECDGA